MHCYKSSFESVVNDRINDSESQKLSPLIWIWKSFGNDPMKLFVFYCLIELS